MQDKNRRDSKNIHIIMHILREEEGGWGGGGGGGGGGAWEMFCAPHDMGSSRRVGHLHYFLTNVFSRMCTLHCYS